MAGQLVSAVVTGTLDGRVVRATCVGGALFGDPEVFVRSWQSARTPFAGHPSGLDEFLDLMCVFDEVATVEFRVETLDDGRRVRPPS